MQVAKDASEQLNMQIPETEDEIMRFLEQAQLENQPTEILYQLADRLKERRTKLYPEEKMINEEGGSSVGLGLEDEEFDTDRKMGKSDMNFNLGSEKQLKNIASSQILDQTVTVTKADGEGQDDGG